jgi:glycosyltransferase involved in cell wall biosynthesis
MQDSGTVDPADEVAGRHTETTAPLVSVVVPTYARSEYLLTALESVVGQTYPNIELLIVDDGSPTPVESALSDVSLQGPTESTRTVEFIRHETNRGANAARNTGIDAASGEYIAFLDDDDYWLETKLEKQVAAFEAAGPDVGLVYVGKRVETTAGVSEDVYDWDGDVVKDLLLGRNFNQFSSIMVRASVLEAAGPPDERFPSWQDRDWFFRLAQHCEFEPVEEPLTVRRTTHDDRIGRNYEEKRDVSYPLFVKEHLPLAESYGPYYAGTFLASMRLALAKSAIGCERYDEARKYLLLAFAANPLYRPVHPYLLATLGGERWFKVAQRLKRAVGGLRKLVTRSG